MTKYTVALPPQYRLPRRCGGVIYYPGKPIEYDEVPAIIQSELAQNPDAWLVVEKRSHKKHEE